MAANDVLVRIRGDASSLTSNLNKAGAQVDKFAGGISKVNSLSGAMGALLGGVVSGGIMMLADRALNAAADLAVLGANVLETQTAFENMAERAGMSGDSILSSIGGATSGMISDTAMMQTAMQAMTSGLQVNADQWTQLGTIAKTQADVMGISTVQAMDAITEALTRGSARGLYQAGIIADIDLATQAYATSLGKTKEQLTEVEQRQAMLNSILDFGKTKMVEAGDAALSAADKLEQASASWQNLKESVAVGLAPAMGSLAGTLYQVSEALQGNNTPLREYQKSLLEAKDGAWAFHPALQAVAAELARLEGLEDGAASEGLRFANIMGTMASAALAAAADLTAFNNVMADAAKHKADPFYTTRATPQTGERAERRVYWTGAAEDLERIDLYEQAAIDADEAIADAAERAAHESQLAWEDSLREQERAWSDLKSTIKTALSATSVTQADIEATALGTYVDKWDEDARRLDAIAARGFAEITAHPDWAAMLKIPPEVIASGEAALKEWAARTSVDVRDLARPDLLADNMDVMVQKVRDYMARQQAIEITVDMVAKAMGGIAGAPTQADVATALGLTAPTLEVPVTFVGAGGVQVGEGTATVADSLIAGVQDAVTNMGISDMVKSSIMTDIEENKRLLYDAGWALWKRVEPGIEAALKKTDWVYVFANHLAPYVWEIMKQRGMI